MINSNFPHILIRKESQISQLKNSVLDQFLFHLNFQKILFTFESFWPQLMFSSRISNRSSLGSRIQKSDIVPKKVISSSQYLQLCKSKQQKADDLIYDSLNHYEKQISLLKGCLSLAEAKQNFSRKQNTMRQIFDFAQSLPVPFEPLTEEEQLSIKPNYLTEKAKQCQQLADILEEKQENERRAQEQFLRVLTEQYHEDSSKQIEGLINIERILNRKISKKHTQAFRQISRKAYPEKPSETTIKNILTSSFTMVSIKMKQTKEYVFRTILKQFGLSSIAEQIEANMKLKGKALMGLKEYPRLNLRRAFWRWYLSTTDHGDRLFQNAADKLVLYTNINKTSFFYRLLNTVKVRQIKVDPKVKRMTVMFYLYTKIFFERPMREFFEKVKIMSSQQNEEKEMCQNIIKCSELREKDLMKKWVKSLKNFREKQLMKKNIVHGFAKRLVQVSQQKKKFLIEEWRGLADQNSKIAQVKGKFLRKLLLTKTGRIVQAFKTMKNIPTKNVSTKKFLKATKFEKGLASFAQRTIKRALDAFKNEFQEGQAQKKRAVIQLIDCTQGGQKKLYNRWKLLTEKTKLMNECRHMNNIFQTLFFVIKSTADLAFIENKDTLLKEKALSQLFKNLSGNLSDTLRRWRQINTIQKLRDSVSQKQKQMLLKVLNGLLKNSKTAQIRDAISKFRTNRRITQIQRNFLKRLLMSKAGLVVIGFRKIQSLPQKRNNEAFKKATKFEKGLASFAQRTIKRALDAFKNEFQEGQAQKKRAVIQLIDCTQGGQKKLYNRWKLLTEKTKLMNECRHMNNIFQTLFFVIKSTADLAFIENKDTLLKEKALSQLFKNLSGNLSDTLRRWRQINTIQKLRDSVSQKQKQMLLKVLNGLLKNSKTAQIRDAISKFRTNRRITQIQRNFLKRLLMSKAGLVVIGFRKIQSLPQKRNNEAFKKATKFEKGLASFAQRTIKRALDAFKNEFQEGQAQKKRAVIQLIDCTQGGQKKLYNRWKLLTEKTKLMNECRHMNNIFQTLFFVIKSTADLAFIENKDTLLKEKALSQLFKNLSGNLSDTLRRWRQINTIQKLRDSVSQKQKQMLLKVLNGLLKNSKTAQIRDAISKFRTNRRITQIQRNFLKRLLMSKAGLVVIGFRKIQSLPQKRNNEAFKKATKFEKGLASFAQRTIKRALDAFKNEFQEGQAQKKRAVIQLIDCTQGGQKKLYNRWKLLTEKTKLMNECRHMNNIFQTLFFVIKSTADLAFIENKDTLLKEKALSQLFKNLSGNLSDTLRRWRQINTIQKLRDSVSQKQKQMLLKVLNGLLKNSKTAQIRDAISKFRTNRRITQIQRNFLKRLLMSKAGLVVIGFRKIQSLPQKRNNEAFKKATKFEKGLASFAQRTIKRALDAFKNEFQEGQAQKKRAVIQLIDCTQGGQKKLYNRWKLLTEKTKLMNECRHMNNIFQTLFFVIKSTADLAFIENKDTLLKEKALSQLFKNLSGNLSDTLRRWRQINTIQKLRDSVSQKQKQMLLKVLNGLLKNSKTAQIRDAISKFRTNRRITQIQRNFLKRLLMSKAGLVVIGFRKIQSLPQKRNNEAFKKATKFEKGLASFAQRTIKRALDAFKNEFQEGQAQKKRAVIQLIDCTQGGQKKLYNRWKLLTEKTKLMNECRHMNNIFQTLFFVIKSTADLAFIENKDTLLKEKALSQLFKNLSGNLSDTLRRWRQINTIQKLRDSVSQKQKQMLLKVLNGLLKNSKTAQIRDAISKFRTNRRITQIQRNFLKRLLMSKAGLVVIGFRKIQSLPQKRNNEAFKKATKFEKGLASFAQRTIKRALDAFKNEFQEGQAQKKRAVIQLIDCTQGGQKKLYNRWKLLTEKTKLMNECRHMNNIFQTLFFVIKSTADLAFIENKDTLLKEKALSQLFKNLSGNLSDTLRRWRQINTIQKLRDSVSQKQKQMLLKVLNGLLKNSKTAQIRDAISKFRTNRRITQIQRNFLKRLLMSKAGLVVIGFRKIQSLPQKRNNEAFKKATKFEKGLASFAQRTIKRALDAFKNEFQEGQAQKKRAVIQLIDCTQGGQKKLYNRWKLLTEKTKLMNECRHMNNIFQTLFFVIKSTADLAFIENKDTLLKEKALSQLFKNLSGNLSDTLRRWRQINTIQKLRDSVSQKQKQMLLKVLNGLLKNSKTAQIRDAISKFRTNRRITQIQRNFLKRLLMSKAGLVVIGFRKIQSLPQKRNNEAFKKATKFEKGLASFAQRTIKRALDAFKNEFQEGQAQKKRAVIQLIDCTQGGQKKLYNRWKLLTEKTKLMNECRHMNNIFQTLFFVIKSTADLAFIENKDTLLKEKALSQLFKNLSGNLSDTLRRWRQINTIQKLRDSVSQKQKQMLLKVLNGLLKNSKTAQIRDAISKFRTNRRITQIQRNFLKRLLMSKAGLVVIGFRKIQSLPQKRNNEAFKKATKFEKGLASFAQRTIKRALDAFKNEFQEGQAQKKRAVIQLIDCTQGGQKKLYNRWKLLTEKTKLMNECRHMNNIFQTLFFVIKSTADLAFIENKDTLLKEKALSQLFKNLSGNLSDTLRRWRQINTIQKLRDSVSQKQKQMLLKVLNGLLKNSKTAQIRDAISKFRTNRRITQIQRNFLKRLLMSKAGLVVIGFRKIQSLPQKRNNEAFKKATKFEKALASFAQRTIKRALDAFKNEFQEGQAQKKRAVIQLIDCTQGGQKKLYNRWKLLTEKTKLMNECRHMNNIFQTLFFVIKSTADLAFIENKDTLLKEKALSQLFKNLSGNLSDTLRRWRQINTIQKLRDSVSQKQKQMLLKVLNGLLKNSKTAQIRDAISKFRTNRRITQIQRNFLKRLLMSKAGLVVIGFRKIQSLPQKRNNEAFKKATKFEKGLASFAQRTIKRALDAFKNEFQEGQAQKKRAVIQLIDCTQGGQKKLYNRWKLLTEKTKLMNECRHMNNIFQTLFFVIKSTADLAFIENKDTLLKEKALSQLFKNLSGNLSDTLRRWRQINTIQKLRDSVSQKQKQMLLKVLNGLLKNSKTAQIRDAISKFRTNRRITQIQRNFLKRLLMSKAGLVVIGFRKIQSLPQKRNNEAFKKATKFEKGLASFAQRTIKRALDAFKNEFQEGQAQKKRAVIQLIDCTQGGQKKLYNRWKLLTEKTKLMNECRHMNNIFQTLFFVIKSTADLAFIENKDTLLKEKALSQLFKNLSGNLSDTLRRWRQINTIQKLRDSVSQKQKQMLLKVLNGLLKNSKTAQIRDAISKFRTNRRITQIQRNFLKRLLMSKAGLVVIGFRKIQSLPQKRNNEAFKKATKFEKGLASFAQRTIKRALDAFKNEFQEGQAQKKRAVIQLIDCTQGGQKRYFNRWKSEVEQNRLYERCQVLIQVFSNCAASLNRNFSLLYSTKQYNMHSISVLHKYFTKLSDQTNSSLGLTLQKLKEHSEEHRQNKWFYRAAQTFAVRTRINMQKSMWRLKLNAYTNGVLYDAAMMVKLKKMYNNIRKYYELTLFRAFLMIDKYGKAAQNLEISASRHTSDFIKLHGSFKDESIISDTSNNELQSFREDGLYFANRKAAVTLIENVFNQNLSNQLNRWKYNAIPEKQQYESTLQLQRELPDTLCFLNQSKSISSIFNVLKSMRLKDLAYGLRAILNYGFKSSNENAYDQNLEERIELINQQNRLMEEIRDYKKENESLIQEIQIKESHLEEANKAVTLLSLRINFMITQKFVTLVEKVVQNSNWKNLNEGFDGIIEKANQNFEQEQSQHMYQE